MTYASTVYQPFTSLKFTSMGGTFLSNQYLGGDFCTNLCVNSGCVAFRRFGHICYTYSTFDTLVGQTDQNYLTYNVFVLNSAFASRKRTYLTLPGIAFTGNDLSTQPSAASSCSAICDMNLPCSQVYVSLHAADQKADCMLKSVGSSTFVNVTNSYSVLATVPKRLYAPLTNTTYSGSSYFNLIGNVTFCSSGMYFFVVGY